MAPYLYSVQYDISSNIQTVQYSTPPRTEDPYSTTVPGRWLDQPSGRYHACADLWSRIN
jgi:hypothetical protein